MKTITCPYCLMTSAHPEDVAQGYCGNCHEFTREKRMTEIEALAVRVLEDGRELAAQGMIYTWRLTIGPPGSMFVDDFYCYDNAADCVAAVESWDGSGDPPGPWHRHLRTARRRKFDWVDGERQVVEEWTQA